MKKSIILLLTALLIITMVGCGAKEENELVGTWIDRDKDTLTLKDDGTYESTHYYDKEGTWGVNEDVIVFKTLFDKEKNIKYRIEENDGNTYMIFEENDLLFGGDKETKFVKQKDK